MITLQGRVAGKTRFNATISVSEEAAKNIAIILRKQGAGALRIAALGGGCSGLQYKIQLENTPTESDLIFQVDTCFIVIDPKSFIYLSGIEIDWVIQNLTPTIVFKNPGAKSSCSCGMSFEPGGEDK